MYKLPPVFVLPQQLELPTVMYKLPQLQGVEPEVLKMTPEEREDWESYEELTKQQEDVLRKLKKLKSHIEQLKFHIENHQLPATTKPIEQPHLISKEMSGAVKLESQGGVIHDLVITCDPDHPPYSLIVLRNWMKECGLHVYARSHVHSSVDKYCRLIPNFNSMKVGDKDRSMCQVALTLIYKRGLRDVSLLASSSKEVAIEGEANIARFLSRLMSAPYNYEQQDEASVAEVDLWLDLAHSSLIHGNRVQQAAVIRALENRLAHADWLAGEKVSIADVVMWSAMPQYPVNCYRNVHKWFMRFVRSVEIEVGENGDRNVLFTKKTLMQLLLDLGVQCVTTEHPEVHTVEAMMKYVHHLPGAHTKNLFLKDKQKNLYLLSVKHDRKVNLNDIGEIIKAKELRFAGEDILFQTLGVKQGCVTAFSLANDKERRVKFLCDSQLLGNDFETIYFHPLTNEATTGVTPDGLQKFLNYTGHDPVLINFVT